MQNIIFSKRNGILNKFTLEEYAALCGHLELVRMELGEVLYEAGEEAPFVHFPIDGMVFLLHPMKNGPSVEIALIGCDGALGIARNNQATLNCAIVAQSRQCLPDPKKLLHGRHRAKRSPFRSVRQTYSGTSHPNCTNNPLS